MHLARLSLTDWRNYATADLVLERGATVLAGPNGQGKTNLVEAVGYLSTLGSHRVAGDAALVRSGAEQAVIRAVVATGEREVLAEVLINRSGRNRAQLNRSAVRPREIVRAVSSVLFAPEDLALVRGEPAARRRFADELLVQRAPRLSGVLGDYDEALRQRNGLLRAGRAGADTATLDVWDERLVTTGSLVVQARQALVADLAPLVAAQYAFVAGDGHPVALTVEPSIGVGSADEDPGDLAGIGERFRAALAEVRRRELERGITLVGPHRDDLGIALNGLPARSTASHGESWSLALALRLGAVELLRADGRGDPIVILDDVFAELDALRRARLADRVAEYEQVLVTAAVEGDVPKGLQGRVVRIQGGRIVPEAA